MFMWWVNDILGGG